MAERLAAYSGRLVGRIMKIFIQLFDDLLLLVGGTCIIYGLALISIPAAWVFAGVFLIAFGVLIGKVKAKNVNN